jgi:hypothetical protein
MKSDRFTFGFDRFTFGSLTIAGVFIGTDGSSTKSIRLLVLLGSDHSSVNWLGVELSNSRSTEWRWYGSNRSFTPDRSRVPVCSSIGTDHFNLVKTAVCNKQTVRAVTVL